MTLEEIAQATSGRVVAGAPDTSIDGFSIDSRSVDTGDLFVALRGDRFDGHRFVEGAFAAGACGALVSERDALGVSPTGGIVVDDTLLALQRLAGYVRRASGTRVVAVTGSVGKTTTKELAAAVASARYRVFKTEGNLNNHIGLPLSLLELRSRPEVAVVELGMNHSGEISRLVAIAQPEMRVWTNVAEVHAEFFASLDHIADAKGEILEGATTDTVAVVNAGDPRVMARVSEFEGTVKTFGLGVDADVTASAVEDHGFDGMRVQLNTPVGMTVVSTPLSGRGNLANLLAAVAVGVELEVSLDALAEQVKRVGPPPHRGQVHRLARGVVVVDDSYNASPLAMETALAVLSSDTHSGRRIAVVGEMLELGDRALELHRGVGRAAAAAGLGLLVTVGGEMARALGTAAAEAGLATDVVFHFETSDDAAERVSRLIQDDDLVLVKGSRRVRTDVVVSRLVGEWT